MFFIRKYSILILLLSMIYSELQGKFIFESDSNYSYESDSINILIIKDEWHTAFLFNVNDSLLSRIPVLNEFEEFKFVDIGWGDEEFFQNPSDDIYLAAKAILYPTNSVIRIAGLISGIENILLRVDYCVELTISITQFNKLCNFINNSFELDKNFEYIIASKRPSGEVIFYKSNLKYHLFYTCNTWVADALDFIGFDIDISGLITAEQLLDELINLGKVLKYEN